MTATTTDARGAWQQGRRPITIAILAMGGEGGGVLSNWIADTGRAAGWITQATSVAGVAQRTGATVYYIEMYPPAVDAAASARSEPILSTMPSPGELDVLIASELMEAGRAVQRGFVTPDRTTLIASTNRVYSIDEKSSLGDGRVDSEELLAAAQRAAKQLIANDFSVLATQARSVISASLFGALAGSGALAFTREQFEETIRATGTGVETSLKAFAAGYEAAQQAQAARETQAEQAAQPASAPVPVTIGLRPRDPEAEREQRMTELAATSPRQVVGPALSAQADRIASFFPAAARLMLLRGVERTALYQDMAYADRYLNRVARVVGYEPDPDNAARLSTETARYLALWMCYQDTIQVALQKTRAARLEGIREEARAASDQPVLTREYLHPQLEEITDTLPAGLGAKLRDSAAFAKLVHLVAHKGIVVNTTSVWGYTTLSTLARLRPIRPKSLRFVHEQGEIDGFLDQVCSVAHRDYELACELMCCVRVLKGYGETWERGEHSFAALRGAAEKVLGRSDGAATLARLREIALNDESGEKLASEVQALNR